MLPDKEYNQIWTSRNITKTSIYSAWNKGQFLIKSYYQLLRGMAAPRLPRGNIEEFNAAEMGRGIPPDDVLRPSYPDSDKA